MTNVVNISGETERLHLDVAVDRPRVVEVLAVLLKQYLRYKQQPILPKGYEVQAMRAIWASTLLSKDETLLQLESIEPNPVAYSLRMGIKRCGWILFKLGGTALMEEVCDELEDRGGKSGVRWAVTLDHAWDGIGDEKDFWVC